MGKNTFFHYRKRRYHCSCCQKHFYESFPLLPKHCRITTRLAFYALHLLMSHQNVHSTATLLSVSDSFLFCCLRDVRYPKPSRLPIILSIDEFKGNAGGQKFQAILTDPKIISSLTSSHHIPRYLLCSISMNSLTKRRHDTLLLT